MMSFKELIMFILSLLAVIFISMNWNAKAEVEGLTDDLSGETAKVIAVVEGDTIYFEDY